MKFEARSAAVIRDFEKMYKLVALYQGNREQLNPHLRNFDAALQASLGDPDFKEGMIQFDLLMQGVFTQGFEVFKSERPELTMGYALFCEGVRSISASRGLSANEILEWCLLLRDCLRPRQGESVDLASILWRNRFQHLKVHIFNSLLNIEEIGLDIGEDEETDEDFNPFTTEDEKIDRTLAKEELAQNELIKRHKSMRRRSKDNVNGVGLGNARDEFWALPSAQKFVHSVLPMDEGEVQRLKNNLADAAYSDRAKNLVRFSADEVYALRTELEAYDANHIEFNILVGLFDALKSWDKIPKNSQDLILRQIDQTAKSILQRFHAGLMLYLLKHLGEIQGRAEFKTLVSSIAHGIKNALEKLENRRLLLDSLETEGGQRTGFAILRLLKPEDWNSIMDTCVDEKRRSSAAGFLDFLFRQSPDIEKYLFSMGAKRLKFLLPILVQRQWDQKENFIIKCAQSTSSEVAEASLVALSQMQISAEQAMVIFKKLPDKLRSELIERILLNKTEELWKSFAQLLVKNSEWKKFNDHAAVAAVKIIVCALKEMGLQNLRPWFETRKFRFWPAFARERELILLALVSLKNPSLNAQIDEILSQEAKLLFQKKSLRARIRERVG